MPPNSSIECFTVPIIFPEALIIALQKKCPLISHAKANEILLNAPSIALPVDFLPRFHLAANIVRQEKDTVAEEAENLPFGIDLFFAALKVSWTDSEIDIDDLKEQVTNLYRNNGWLE